MTHPHNRAERLRKKYEKEIKDPKRGRSASKRIAKERLKEEETKGELKELAGFIGAHD